MDRNIYIVDLFDEIVSKVSAILTPSLQALDSNITGVHYDYGHPKEIIESLMQKDKSNTFMFQKYPLVALFQDFPERITNTVGAPNEVTLHLIIANSTKQTFKSNERYSRNFKPFLYPIYNELMKQISNSKHILNYGADNIQHTKIDRLFWGKEGLYGNEGNIFNDFLDIIEIRDLKFKTYLKNC